MHAARWIVSTAGTILQTVQRPPYFVAASLMDAGGRVICHVFGIDHDTNVRASASTVKGAE